ncbi:hypothetical protein SEA_NEFERTHENA_57 [Microbacterium phage Neferthena]|uniref:Uncharacterized protein n=1 Tax=Microbacterium phage Neferthena TaxID=2301539 RepID=A0A385D4L2_9CAUD|nr:hypothetical protein HOT92_gp45 [Microbacterium phage Neferthena]AXQ52920.1 hypothetical protein SEA_NEFERTHENA_57 [Microbacterium phage Neferthena]
MNADRRMAGRVLVELLNEGSINGEISDQAHEVIGETLAHLQKGEYHQLRSQEKYDGTSPSNTKQVAICRVALPALEAAMHAYNSDDFGECITQVTIAIETDGTPPKKERRKRRGNG